MIKRYFRELYSDEVIARWRSAGHLATSSVAYAEALAAVHRKKREADLTDALVQRVIEALNQDWQGFIRVEVNDDLNEHIVHLVETYPLRGFDAIHLASARVIHEVMPRGFCFACFDRALLSAAQAEGMTTFPSLDTLE